MNFSLVTNEKLREAYINFANPRTYGLIQPSEMISSSFSFTETKYSPVRDGDCCPTLVAFLAQARFHVSLYNQHSDRNRTKDKSLSVAIYFRDGVLGKNVSIEAFIQNEFLTSAVLLAKHSTQVSFYVDITDEAALRHLESKLFDSSKKSDFFVSETPDKFSIAFL